MKMKRTASSVLISILSLAMILSIVASCKEDDDVVSGEVKLLSFGPSGVKLGDEIRFIGMNLGKVTSIDLTGASVPASAFKSQNAEQIVLVVPQETTEGPVTLKTAEGDVVSKTVLSFEVPVVVKSITAEARPGGNITITGDYLNWVKEVRFAPDTAVVKFVSQTMNQLVVTVPMVAQTGSVILNTGGTEPLSIESTKALVVTLPAIASFTPATGMIGKDITITGTNLDLVESISFSGTATPVTKFTSKMPAQLVVTVPAGATKGKFTLNSYSKVNVESKTELLIGK